MPRLAPAAVMMLLAALAGCPAPGGAGAACPPQTREIAPNSAFTLTLVDHGEKPRAGVAVKVVRTPRVAQAACPGKLRDEATATTDADGKAEFWNMERGTYAVEGTDLDGAKLDFGAKATAKAFMVRPAGLATAITPRPANLVDATLLSNYQMALAEPPEAGRASFTIADAAAAKAFAAWIRDPDPALTGTDFAKARLVALYRTLAFPGCFASLVFERTAAGVAFRVDQREIPKGVACAAPAMPAGSFWAVAVLPADPKPVVGTTALTADAAWLVPAPTPAPPASPTPMPVAEPSPEGSPGGAKPSTPPASPTAAP